jgi:two-component system response regulator HydG
VEGARVQDEGLDVLVVDDDASNLASLDKTLSREGWRTEATSDGRAAIARLRGGRVAVLLTDLMMPGVDGMELLRTAASTSPHTAVVLMTAYGTVETAVAAMKDGAYDFLTKPLRRADVVRAVKRALERATLRFENEDLRAALAAQGSQRQIIGNSPLMRRAVELAEQVAPARTTVMLQGESGTGKEVFARAIHRLSPRRERPFVAVNCAAIPEQLLESELFGHEKGAFTGASMRRDGRFQAASDGTLLLDEVGDLPLPLQGKLLRAIQEGEVDRVGSPTPEAVDVRVIAATHRDLQAEAEAGRFRTDLLYRLNVITIELPPLRARPGDVPALAQHFLRRFAERNNKPVRALTPAALEALQAHTWPGNVRELENVIERAVVLCREDVIDLPDLPPQLQEGGDDGRVMQIPVGTSLEEIERIALHETLRMTGGDKRRAAALLGIAVRTIYRRLEPRTTTDRDPP